MITPFFLLLLLFILVMPFAKAVATRVERSALPRDEVLALRKLLESAEQRAEASEARVNQLEERLDFLEKLLQAPKPGGTLPPGSS